MDWLVLVHQLWHRMIKEHAKAIHLVPTRLPDNIEEGVRARTHAYAHIPACLHSSPSVYIWLMQCGCEQGCWPYRVLDEVYNFLDNTGSCYTASPAEVCAIEESMPKGEACYYSLRVVRRRTTALEDPNGRTISSFELWTLQKSMFWFEVAMHSRKRGWADCYSSVLLLICCTAHVSSEKVNIVNFFRTRHKPTTLETSKKKFANRKKKWFDLIGCETNGYNIVIIIIFSFSYSHLLWALNTKPGPTRCK